MGTLADSAVFVCLAAKNRDYELYINGKLERLIATTEPPKESSNPKNRIAFLSHGLAGVAVAHLKVQPFVDQTNNIKSFYDMNKKNKAEEILSTDCFLKDKTIYNFYSTNQFGTSLTAGMSLGSGKLSQTGGDFQDFDFARAVASLRKAAGQFGETDHPFYPADSSVFERKITVENLKKMLENYDFLFSVVSMASPVVGFDPNITSAIAELTLQEHVGTQRAAFQTPFAPIAFRTLTTLLKRFFEVDRFLPTVVWNVLRNTPYLLQKSLTPDNNPYLQGVVSYDKALYLLRRVFLTEAEQCRVTERILATGKYWAVSIHEREDWITKKLFATAEVPFPTKVAFRAIFPDILEINQDEEVGSVTIDLQESFDESKEITISKSGQDDLRVVRSGGAAPLEGILKNYGLLSPGAASKLVARDIRSCVVSADMREIYKVVFTTQTGTVKIASKNYDKTAKGNRPTQKYQAEFPQGLSTFGFAINAKDNTVVGLLFASPIAPLTPRPLADTLQKPLTQLLEVQVNPAPYDLTGFFDAAFRFDINAFSKAECELNNNTVSLLKYKPNEYVAQAKATRASIESIFPKACISFNSFLPVRMGELKVCLKGFFRTKFSESTEVTLFCNSQGEPVLDFNEVYLRLCIAVIENHPLDGLIEAQNRFFEAHKLSMTSVKPLNEEEIVRADAAAKKGPLAVTGVLTCNNYGCSATYDIKENNEKCAGHPGTWDFGHTGVNIESALQNDAALLWKPHWTCCGKGWNEQCSSFHFHERKAHRMNIDIEDPFAQQVFRKNIRKNWLNKIKPMAEADEKHLRRKIGQFATRQGCKPEVRLPDDSDGQFVEAL